VFFLLPPVTAVMLALFFALAGWRAWRQRHAVRVAPRGRRGRRGRRAAGGAPPLVPAALLRGADRTWIVFTTRRCRVCREVAARLRGLVPDSQVAEVDATREPRLFEAFGLRRLPAVLLANRYGQVTTRLVGLREIDAFTADRSLPG
jgi:hypothetical protein